VLGALSPDVDFVLMPLGWDIYLRFHQVGTHSLAGALGMGLASAAIVRLFAPHTRFGTLAAAAVAGAVSHLVADIASGAILRPGWPLTDAPISAPLVAMADPWTIGILLSAAVAAWWHPEWRRQAAMTGLLVLIAFLSIKAALLGIALRAPAGTTVLGSARDWHIDAQWGSLTEWIVFGRTGDVLTQRRIDVRGSPPALLLAVSSERTALIDASRELASVRNFLRVHDLVFAVQRDHEDGDGGVVLWSDVRFCWRDPPPDAPVQCALWFGGEYDDDDTFVTQEVRVGSWIQRRPVD
jgi:membrane-bound metal-dependent hydrolase YbcI (DUF457 family)